MATTEQELTPNAEDNDDTGTPLPQPMPDDLKEAGWKMSRVAGKFRAKNERKQIFSHAVDSPEEAIETARRIEAGEKPVLKGDGNTVFENPAPAEADAAQDDNRTATYGPLPAGVAYRKEFRLEGELRLDGGTQIREELNLERVAQYADDKRRGDVFPPGTVFFDGTDHWLAAGFHRYFADKTNGLEKAVFDVRLGTKRDAILFSVGENATHGLGRTNAEKRLAVDTLLKDPEWSIWSNNMIARAARVSQTFVGLRRKEIDSQTAPTQNVLRSRLSPTVGDGAQTVTDVQPGPSENLATPTKRIGRDGVARDTSNIGRAARPQTPEIANDAPEDDVIPAETDINVDDVEVVQPEGEESQDEGSSEAIDKTRIAFAVSAATAADRELWQSGTIELHIHLNPQGKEKPGTALVSGKHTHTNPVFLTCTAEDLNPMPDPLKSIIQKIGEAFETRGKTQPAATKRTKKTRVASGKKKATKRPVKSVVKKKTTKAAPKKKKPVARAKPKPKARKK